MIPHLQSVRAFLSGDGTLLLPELQLLLFALGLLLIDRWLTPKEKYWNAALALAGVAFSAFTLHIQYGKMVALRLASTESPGLLGFHQSLLVDPFFLLFAALMLAALALVLLLSVRFLELTDESRGSYYPLLLLACAGTLLLAESVNIVVLFCGLQIAAASCYALLGYANSGAAVFQAKRSFAVLWACSSVALAIGFLLLYGDFQTANLGRIGAILDARLDKGILFAGLTSWHAILALLCLALGAFFLVAAAPLHWLDPEICEFAPTPIAGFLGAAVKVAGFALLLRLFVFLFLFAQQKWIHVWGGVGLLSLLWGNIAAVRQRKVLRVLAYAAVAQTGFVVLGMVAANETAFAGIVYHLAAYAFAALGVFGVLIAASERIGSDATLEDLRGLWQRSPALAWLLLLFLFSLAGVPLTAGFVAKYFIVKGIFASHPELAIFAAANALFSAYVYGRIAARAFRAPVVEGATEKGTAPKLASPTAQDSAAQPTTIASGPPPEPLTVSNAQAVALTIAAFVSLAAGLYPAPFLRLASYVFGQ
jgi:NADH-quinone oxidoreductase subunit N